MPNVQTLIDEISTLPKDMLDEIYLFIISLKQKADLAEAVQAEDGLQEQAAESVKITRASFIGCMKGKVRMSDDFDAPLDDFKEYME